MRIVYLYVNNGNTDVPIPWNPKSRSENAFATDFYTEGYSSMWRMAIDYGIVDEVLVVVESARSPGHVRYGKNFSCLVVPHIDILNSYLRDDDILFCRVGFKSWFPFLARAHEAKRWIFFYQAAANRGNWPFWDVVWNDMINDHRIDETGRFHWAYMKPTNPDLFYPEKVSRQYDVCIGASHIHDKKGQWKVVQAVSAYRRKYGHDLKCILPGAFRGGEKTITIIPTIRHENLDILLPGMLHRGALRDIYCASKLFVHCGAAGQNDRGVLEAMRCGTPVMLANTKYHAPFTYQTNLTMVTSNDPDQIASDIHTALRRDPESLREKVFSYYEQNASLEKVILPAFDRLMNFIRQQPVADRNYLRKCYGLGLYKERPSET